MIYPYERLTPEHVADVQRMRDQQMRELCRENDRLQNELYLMTQRLNRILPLLEEMGIDIDVMLATKEAFK